MSGGNREPGRSVTSKVLAIIEVFEASRRSLSLTEISELSGVPMSTAHRLVTELLEWGMLSRGPNGKIQLGLRIWAIAQNAGRPLRDAAKPYIQDLFSLTRETSQLAVRDGDMALYVERVYSSQRIPRTTRVGGRLPLHATAVGKVMLAYSADWVADAYLQRPLAALTGHTHVNSARLRDELAQVREQGYATTQEEVRIGSCSIAVPVFHTGRFSCSIALVVPSTHASGMARRLPALHGISKRIEAATAHIPLGTLLGTAINPEPAPTPFE
ncbi:IclR family transcriptional regulator [Paeniglutamicibacter kerguelensis]|uniref:DNA-binding IclR family transcriptional regulator n=1 Tax=Paeniglutamicibacter kerguelensis TaxID=254788 RepID=A0ABS4XHT2_9MICC|nr:IclR family transcriptional regulator [Paeniglutamicibacter kerguelensis]MBP2387866.1 DNA-binding IclR family transcriptional regulator [Paeniglutamicibacter kerguelensis]